MFPFVGSSNSSAILNQRKKPTLFILVNSYIFSLRLTYFMQLNMLPCWDKLKLNTACVYCMKALRDSKMKVTALTSPNQHIGRSIPSEHLVLMATAARAAQVIGNLKCWGGPRESVSRRKAWCFTELLCRDEHPLLSARFPCLKIHITGVPV